MKKYIFLILFVGSLGGFGQVLPTPQNPVAIIDFYNSVSLNFSFDATGLFNSVTNGQALYFEVEVDNGTSSKTYRTANYLFATPNNTYSFSRTMAYGSSYAFKVKAFFKESTFGATRESVVSTQSNTISASNPRGVTVLTHGFSGTGSLDASWKTNARALRSRLSSESGPGKGATILINNSNTGFWEFLKGENGALDLNEELIFIFDWANMSNKPLLGNETGYLESAADVLYSLLINPTVRHSNGQLTQLGGGIAGQLLINKNTHFIGHSRGTIVMLQLLHRLKANFSTIDIERLTLLDPHPAGTYGDVKRANISGSPENLPGVYGAATSCILQFCADGGQSIYLTVPDNVTKVENFYRQGTFYEPIAESYDLSPFMGVPLVGGNNSYLMNNDVMTAGVAGLAGFLGGAHSAVPTWYFQTVDLSQPLTSSQITANWFSTSVGSFMAGKTRETAGYNITNLPSIPIRASLSDYNNALNIRTGKATLLKVFNGDFNYGNGSGWSLNNMGWSAPRVMNDELILHPTESKWAAHNMMYFPSGFTAISMDIRLDVGTYTDATIPLLIVEFYNANGQKFRQALKSIPLTNTTYSRFHFGIPTELQGKNGTFRLLFGDNGALNDYGNTNLVMNIDNVELGTNTTTVPPPVITASKTSIQGGQSITISATGCENGTVYWTNNQSGQSISVTPFENATYAAICGDQGFYSSPSNVVSITVNYTHHLASAEYFIDTDPGFGLANPLNITTGGGTINQTVAIDMTPHNLSQGVHTISLRVKDDNDNWSLTHTKTFLVLGSSTGGGNSIADVEYFIDSLKQDKSNLVSTGITANNDEQITIAIPQNVPQGVHTVAFRVKDNQGKYSLFHTKTYLVLGSGTGGNTLSKIEYFFDTDPGFGSGTQVDYTAAEGATQMIDIDVSSLSAGVHVLNVRVKNAANQWSLTHAKVFLVMPDLGGNATVSRIEYFIGDNDPGPDAATSVAFSPNPDGRNVIASFDLDVSDYPDGDLRLNFRVKDSEGRWSTIVARTIVKQGSVEILRIEADIYPDHYDVVQQSTVHRYYQLKNGNDQSPLEGAKVKYLVGGQIEVFESTLSDSKGIVDLLVKTGGNDINSPSDDIIPISQTAPISLASVVKNEKELIIKSSQFGSNDFTIKPFSRLMNPKIEYGYTGGIQRGVGLGGKAGFKIGSIEFKASKASAAIGAKQGLDLTIRPWSSDPNKMEVSVAYMPGFFVEGTLGPKVEADLSKIIAVEGGAYLEGEVGRSLRQEFRYTLDLNNRSDLFRTAYYILLLNSIEYPNALRAANFFKRLSGFNFSTYDPPVVMSGIATEAALSANTGIGVNAAFFKKGNKEPRVGIDVEFSGGGSLGLENYKVIENNTNNTEYITKASASYDISGTWGPGLALIGNSEQEAPPSDSSGLSFADFLFQGGHYSFGINRKFAGTVPTEVSFDVSSSKEITLEGESFTKEIINNYSFNGSLINNIIQKAKSKSLNSQGNSLTNLVTYNRLNPISIFNSASNNNNFIKNLTDFAKEATSSSVNTTLNSAIKNSSEKSFYNTFEGGVPFEIAFGLYIQFEVNASAYTKYSYPQREDIYIPSLGKYFTKFELPNSDLNMNLPFQNPIDVIMVAATQKVGEVETNIRESAAEFINKFQASVSSVFNKIFTNNGGTQLSLSAATIYDFKAEKPSKINGISSSNTPTILTIDTPSAPTAFAENTDLIFSYYYPENLLKAKIGLDTFQIITDVFYLNAYVNTQRLNTAPNGNFNINTQFSTFDLKRSGLPLGSTVKLIFLPLNSSQWEIIGDVNTTIPFNRLGIYAVAAKLLTDNVSPLINVQYPPIVASGNMVVSFTENGSGINWSKTTLFVNGQRYLFERVQNQLAFTIPFSSIDKIASGIYNIEIFTSDNAGNLSYYKHIYPCEGGISINSVSQLSPYKYSGNGIIEINAGNLIGTDIELKSTKAIILSPGFEAKEGKSFTAQIGGCNN